MYEKLLEYVNDGQAILTGGEIHPDIPTICDVGHHAGQRIKADSEVKHYGFGLFVSTVGGAEISFDGGGAMNREKDGAGSRFSWTLLRASTAQLDLLGYDLEKVKAALIVLDSKCKIRQTVFDSGLGL